MLEFLLIEKFLVAIGIGALIGVEREREKMDKKTNGIGSGFRTFILISLLGAITSYLNNAFSSNTFFIAIFSGFTLLIVLSYLSFSKIENLGIITEISSLITFLLGFISLTEYTILAVILSAVIVLLIESERIVHGFIQSTSQEEWMDSLKFAAIALIVYPILPDKFIDPWNLVNPSKIWLLVVLISGLEFVGYFLMKTVGSKKGVILNGFLGGLVSSTAVTLSMTNQSKKYSKLSPLLALATSVASLTMFARVTIFVGAISPDLFIKLLIFILPQVLVMFGLSVFISRENLFGKKNEGENELDFELGSPFKFAPAFKMAIMFALVKIIVKVAETYLGNSGIYVTSLISGLVDVDALTLSISSLFNDKTIIPSLAVQGILIAVMSNTLIKGMIAKIRGEKTFGNKIFIIFGGTFITGLISIVILFLI